MANNPSLATRDDKRGGAFMFYSLSLGGKITTRLGRNNEGHGKVEGGGTVFVCTRQCRCCVMFGVC